SGSASVVRIPRRCRDGRATGSGIRKGCRFRTVRSAPSGYRTKRGGHKVALRAPAVGGGPAGATNGRGRNRHRVSGRRRGPRTRPNGGAATARPRELRG